uniref:Uncharacterized protein n=1 Tax=Anguilla anguilla TaxID=7936 RepID=A0A0E9THW9_ANGAN
MATFSSPISSTSSSL